MTVTNGFIDTARLNEAVEQGAQGGPSFLTTIMQLASGHEKRNIEWSNQRATWDISYGIQLPKDFADVVALFYTCYGRAYGFRFKDWMDFQIGTFNYNCDVLESVTEQVFATGDGATLAFQIYKVYTATSGDFFLRKITRPVDGTAHVFVDGVEVFGTWSIDYSTGMLTFSGGNAPPMGKTVGIIIDFDVPVRFDVDMMKIKATWVQAAELPSINLIELKE